MDLGNRKITDFKESNHHLFQHMGKAIQEFTGEKKFPLLLFQTFPLNIVEQAFYIAEKRNIKSSKYIYGICRKLK